MAGGASRRGFTLVELMLTTTIFAVVMAAVSSAFVGGIRLLKATFATAEMSLRARDLRDRLLFHAGPPHNDTIWAGLLSGTNNNDVLEGNATKILMHCTAFKPVDNSAVAQTIQLVFKDSGTTKCSFFSEDRYDERWLHRWLNPGGMNLLADYGESTHSTGNSYRPPSPITLAKNSKNEIDKSRFYIHLSGRTDVAGLPIKHNERIVVPVFGRQQETRQDGKGGLDK